MTTTLAIALIIPWVFWGVLAGLLIVARRSWINILLMPIGITIVLLAAANLASEQEAFWASIILHVFLFIFFLSSYVSFILRERKKKR